MKVVLGPRLVQVGIRHLGRASGVPSQGWTGENSGNLGLNPALNAADRCGDMQRVGDAALPAVATGCLGGPFNASNVDLPSRPDG